VLGLRVWGLGLRVQCRANPPPSAPSRARTRAELGSAGDTASITSSFEEEGEVGEEVVDEERRKGVGGSGGSGGGTASVTCSSCTELP